MILQAGLKAADELVAQCPFDAGQDAGKNPTFTKPQTKKYKMPNAQTKA